MLDAELEGRRFIVVSNRQPFAHVHHQNAIRIEKPPSGLTLALEPIVQATGGTWIAAASGSADRETTDADGRVQPRPPGVDYDLRRIFLPPKLHEDYYTGFANSTLWPLCHIAYHQPRFEERWWRAYEQANKIFADVVADEVDGEPAVIFIQDFHLALLPQLLRERCPKAIVAQFWHIPWPNPEAFRICPWRRELLRGLLGNHLLGFHLPYHCNNFIETVDRELQVRVDRETNAVVSSTGSGTHSRTMVAAFPMSVDYPRIEAAANTPASRREAAKLRRQYGHGNRKLVISVERLDYSKGILERLHAIERLFERHPEWREQVEFVHIATPSRTTVRAYQDYAHAIDAAVTSLNERLASPGWTPVQALHIYVEPEKVWDWYQAADAVVVSSLHDGMNLVAKEFVAAGRDDAVLVLSEFTGAARSLREAVQINPYATDAFADGLARALAMPADERRERMRRLRWRVSHYDIGAWARDLLRAIRQREFDAQDFAIQPPAFPVRVSRPSTGVPRLARVGSASAPDTGSD
ncbi:MAG TPA: trehalose-6-phosphate synthase [Terriglobales bacterium]|nr:trehalose-6-phosphate synthase [Terriglobales bacterium]